MKKEISKLNPEKLLEIALKCDNALKNLAEGKIFGGEPVSENWDEKPSFYFNPED